MRSQSIKLYARALAQIMENPEHARSNMKEFLELLTKNRKMNWLPRIIREAKLIAKIKEREETIILETAKPLSAHDPLHKLMHERKAKIVVRLELIAGAILQQGDRRIDTSVRADLAKLKQALLQK